MKTNATVAILAISILLVAGLACGGGGPVATPTPTVTPTPTAEPSPTPTPTHTPGSTPTKCEIDRDAVQAALYAYHTKEGKWPTADGRPGDIVWDKLVPAFLNEKPSTDSKCDWQVDSNPEGQVCLWERC